ncbi:1685_t:CDS:2, partial [Gigaspora rosea]
VSNNLNDITVVDNNLSHSNNSEGSVATLAQDFDPTYGIPDLQAYLTEQLNKQIMFLDSAMGTDVAETNTFSSTRISQADYACEKFAYELNRKSALVKEACME